MTDAQHADLAHVCAQYPYLSSFLAHAEKSVGPAGSANDYAAAGLARAIAEHGPKISYHEYLGFSQCLLFARSNPVLFATWVEERL